MKKFAVFDIDGTVYRDAMSFIVAEPVLEQYGSEAEKKALAAAKRTWKDRGSTESYWVYNKTILALFEDVLPRISPDELQKLIDQILKEKGEFRYAYTTGLIKDLKRKGYVLIAISGSIKNIVEPFALANGFDIVVASGLETVDDVFTGKRVVQTNKGKDIVLRTLIAEHGLDVTDSVGVGDTHRDISFLHVVEHPIAFNPNAAFYEEAARHGWDIVLERKNMIYELTAGKEGYALKRARPIHDGEHRESLQ